MRSVKANYLLTLTNTIMGIIFPMITFPYASRILMADGIGQVNFYQSIIYYITIFTCLGIPAYAVRKVSQVRDKPQELSKNVVEILLVAAGMTTLAYLAVFILGCSVDKIADNFPLFLIMSLSIPLTAIGCEWFYQGIEDFKYITVRGVIVKLAAAILLFLFVKTRQDLLIYGLYTVIGSVGGNVFNIIRLRKYIKRRHYVIKELRPQRHIIPALRIFLIAALTSIYVHLDTVMLGFMKPTEEVGFYAAIYRLSRIAIEVVAALGTAMIPRMSGLYHKGQHDEFCRLANKSYNYVMFVTLPIAIGLIVSSPLLIPLFCGPDFNPAILTLQIISPVVVIVGLSNVVSIQVLFTQSKETLIIKAALAGIVINSTLNFLLIPIFDQNGAAVATVITELSVLTGLIAMGHRYIPISINFNRNVTRIAAAVLAGATACLIYLLPAGDFIRLAMMVLIEAAIYFGITRAFHDPIGQLIVSFVTKKLKK